MNYKDFFKKEIIKTKASGFYREFVPIIRERKTFPFSYIAHEASSDDQFNNETKIWCTNDYLNMSQNEVVIEEMIDVIRKVGASSGGTRNISGTTPYHIELENKIAQFHSREKALVFNSAYLANQTSLWTLCKKIPNIQIFSDELNHASLIQGIKNAGANCHIFAHNDTMQLEKLLSQFDKSTPKLIVFESLYSMDGTKAKIGNYVELAKKYNAMTYLDEVHAVGLYGKEGKGVASECGFSDQIDIINGTLAKAVGQIGGYITGDYDIIEFIRNQAPGFIFTTSIMPAVAAAAKTSLNIIENADDLRQDIFKKANYIKSKLSEKNISYIDSESHIIPVLIGSANRSKEISKKLMEDYNIYVQPIFYPTVPKDSSRLRITVTPKHTYQDIDYLIFAINETINARKTKRDSFSIKVKSPSYA